MAVGGGGYSAVHLESGEELRDVNGCCVKGFGDLLAVEAFGVIGGQEVEDFLFTHLILQERDGVRPFRAYVPGRGVRGARSPSLRAGT